MRPGAINAPRIVGVAHLSSVIRRMFSDEAQFNRLSVRGEISNLRPASASGHLYFKLKEQTALLDCVAWRDIAATFPPLREGLKVVATGKVTTYEQASRYQLTVAEIRPEGQGDLHAAFEELRRELQRQGCFAQERKRALPRFVFRVALVSSPVAEGAIDFRTVLAQRSPHIQIIDVATPVQGDHAPPQIAAAIARAATLGVDVIAVVRGGGSFEDLFAFNAEAVVRAIIASPVPVVTGIGHESDVSLADLAADLRAATPTDAATRFIATADALGLIATQAQRLEHLASARIATHHARLQASARRLERQNPLVRLGERSRSLVRLTMRLSQAQLRVREHSARRRDSAHEHLERAIRRYLERGRTRLALATSALRGRDPEAILELGYAIVRHRGRILTDAATVGAGELIEATLAHGTLAARVEPEPGDERNTG